MTVEQYDYLYRNGSPRERRRLQRKHPNTHRAWLWLRPSTQQGATS